MRTFLTSLIWITHCVLFGSNLPAGFVETKITEQLDPTTMALAPDGTIFVGEKNGTIWVIRDDVRLEDPFIRLEVDNYNERGLSGIAIHPEFEENGWVYVFYTFPESNYNQVSRFTANGDLAIPGSEAVMLEIDPLSGSVHNGGSISFDSENRLFISVGDGSQGLNGQDMNSLNGKVLRINDDGTIPEDNPYYNELVGKYRSIWAYGLRNPFTMAIQANTDRIYACDVGANQWEEVNDILKGKNYGWNLTTGVNPIGAIPDDYKNPIHSYSHSVGCAIVGANFYSPRTISFPEKYYDKFFFADYCQGFIKMIDPETEELLGNFATGINRPIQILTHHDGSMYYLERNGMGGGTIEDNTNSSNGILWKITYSGSGSPFISSQPESLLLPIGETARFELRASGDEALVYQWIIDGIHVEGNQDVLEIENVVLGQNGTQVQCVVTNQIGRDTSEIAILTVTENTRPNPTILRPTNELYAAGDTIFFAGEIFDLEDQNLLADAYSWRIDFHHNAHTHPAMEPINGISEGQFIIPIVGETSTNVWYRIYLKATDSAGLSKTTFVDVFPEIVTFTIQTNPSNLEVNIDGRTTISPAGVQSVKGIARTVQAIPFQKVGGDYLLFENWNLDVTSPTVSFLAEEGEQNYTAEFRRIEEGHGIGLLGEYRNSVAINFSGEPDLIRVDTTIDFILTEQSPLPEIITQDYFIVRWTGLIEPFASGEYTFYTSSDDGAKLWIDDTVVIDRWRQQAVAEADGTFYMEEGNLYPIRLEYFEAEGHSVIQLRWKSDLVKKQIIPKSQLYVVPIEDAETPFEVQIKQNPVRDRIEFSIIAETSGIMTLSVYDLSGKFIKRSPFFFFPGETIYQVRTTELASGFYLLEYRNDESRQVLKLVKY